MKKLIPIIALLVIVVGAIVWQSPREVTSVVTDPQTFIQRNGPMNYSIDVPFGWYPYETGDNGKSVIFTQNQDLQIPPNTDGYAVGPNFTISVNTITDIGGVTTYDQWFEKNAMTEASEFFIEKRSVTIGGLEMFRVRTNGSGVAGEVVHYVYFADAQRVITLSQFPYDQSSEITQMFENAIQTFRVPERQSGGMI